MKYSMFYQTVTGNTKKLAETAEEILKEKAEHVEDAAEADLVFVGIWTEEGTANKAARDYMKTLKNRKVFLFGTAGFGDSKTYFDGILENAKDSLDESNEVVGSFMCRGRISEAVKEHFEDNKD